MLLWKNLIEYKQTHPILHNNQNLMINMLKLHNFTHPPLSPPLSPKEQKDENIDKEKINKEQKIEIDESVESNNSAISLWSIISMN